MTSIGLLEAANGAEQIVHDVSPCVLRQMMGAGVEVEQTVACENEDGNHDECLHRRLLLLDYSPATRRPPRVSP